VDGYGSAGAADGPGGAEGEALEADATEEGAGGGAAGLASAQQASDPASPRPRAAFVRFKMAGTIAVAAAMARNASVREVVGYS
jgi:hypothetical protein